jgi:hypothetical protein
MKNRFLTYFDEKLMGEEYLYVLQQEEKIIRENKDEEDVRRTKKFRIHRKITNLGLWVLFVNLVVHLCIIFFFDLEGEVKTIFRLISLLISTIVPCFSLYAWWYSRRELKKQYAKFSN